MFTTSHLLHGAVTVLLIVGAYIVGFSQGHQAGSTETFIKTVPRRTPSVTPEEIPDIRLFPSYEFPRYAPPADDAGTRGTISL